MEFVERLRLICSEVRELGYFWYVGELTAEVKQASVAVSRQLKLAEGSKLELWMRYMPDFGFNPTPQVNHAYCFHYRDIICETFFLFPNGHSDGGLNSAIFSWPDLDGQSRKYLELGRLGFDKTVLCALDDAQDIYVQVNNRFLTSSNSPKVAVRLGTFDEFLELVLKEAQSTRLRSQYEWEEGECKYVNDVVVEIPVFPPNFHEEHPWALIETRIEDAILARFPDAEIARAFY